MYVLDCMLRHVRHCYGNSSRYRRQWRCGRQSFWTRSRLHIDYDAICRSVRCYVHVISFTRLQLESSDGGNGILGNKPVFLSIHTSIWPSFQVIQSLISFCTFHKRLRYSSQPTAAFIRTHSSTSSLTRSECIWHLADSNSGSSALSVMFTTFKVDISTDASWQNMYKMDGTSH